MMRIAKKTSGAMGIIFTVVILAVAFVPMQTEAANNPYAQWISVFDPVYYNANNAAAAAYANGNVDLLWQYFVNVGITKGDQASAEFNVFIYAKNYPELVQAFGGNIIQYYIHYATTGKAAGMNARTLNGTSQQPVNPNVVAVYSGNGSKVISSVAVPDGIYKVVLKHDGSRNFIVVPYDAYGNRQSSLANEIGNYSGTAILTDNIYGGLIDVKADGNWTISIEKIPVGGSSNMIGNGDAVSPWFNLTAGALVVTTTYTGNRNFIVVVYDETGKRCTSVANEIGSYSGQTVFNKGNATTKYCISVVASGPWSVNFGLTNAVTNVE